MTIIELATTAAALASATISVIAYVQVRRDRRTDRCAKHAAEVQRKMDELKKQLDEKVECHVADMTAVRAEMTGIRTNYLDRFDKVSQAIHEMHSDLTERIEKIMMLLAGKAA